MVKKIRKKKKVMFYAKKGVMERTNFFINFIDFLRYFINNCYIKKIKHSLPRKAADFEVLGLASLITNY